MATLMSYTEDKETLPMNDGTVQNGPPLNGPLHNGHNGPLHNGHTESSEGSPATDKEKVEELEVIHTNERVGSHKNYYEKGGLRTEGDGEDHVGAHQKLGVRFWLAFFALSFSWTGSQIPLYLFGGIPPEIYSDIGGVDRWIWMVVGYLIAFAAVCPFTGALSDLLGRRYVAVLGFVLIIVGMCISSTADTMNTFIAGMTIAGGGAGMGELTALAGTAELVPTAKRGMYVGLQVFTILPWCPSVLWAQLINRDSNWRYVGLLVGVWNFAGLIFILVFYWPPARLNSEGYSVKKILGRVDYVGGFLSIAGFTVFLAALQWSAENYNWGNVHVIAPFCVGAILLILFVCWEIWGAKYPMVPRRLFIIDKRVMILTLGITFFSGANFISLLFFWPTQAFNMYGNDPLGVGIRGLPIGFCIIGGAVICLVLIGVTKGRIKILMIFFSALMTAGNGAMSIAEVYNIGTVYGILVVSCLGVGGIIVPCAIICTIICPDDLIATITALTLSIRVLGGAVGFTAYYNVFYHKFVNVATTVVGENTIAIELLCFDFDTAYAATFAAGNAQFSELRHIIATAPCFTDPIIANPHAFDIIVGATQSAFAQAYKYPYYISIAFGILTFACACGLTDIKKYMDDHVAVVVH